MELERWIVPSYKLQKWGQLVLAQNQFNAQWFENCLAFNPLHEVTMAEKETEENREERSM